MFRPIPETRATSQIVRVWDLPTRLFHWVLVGLIVFSYVTGLLGKLEWHKISGQLILSLIVFRIIWGFVGGGYARFAEFLRGPVETIAYAFGLLRGTSRRYLGHNPLGGWSVMAMLGLILLQAGTGLFATDDIYTDGPLAHLVSDVTRKQLSSIHRTSINVLLVVVGLHVIAAFFYLLVKKDNLIVPMVTGNKRVEKHPPVLHARPPVWLAPVILAVSLVLVLGPIWYWGKG